MTIGAPIPAQPTTHAYDVFISYTAADRAWVEGLLLDALDTAGVRVHTEDAFALGVPRLVEFERAIQQSTRTLLVLSPAYLVDTFGQFVDVLVNSYGMETATWPVIPLILQPVALPARLSQLVPLNVCHPEGQADALIRLFAELQRPLPGPKPLPECPYPGMVPFDEADSARFFGREPEVQDLLDQLRLHPFLAVIGASGSGKSSLVRAGLIPALRKSRLFGAGTWTVRIMRPGASPLAYLAEALAGSADPAAESDPNTVLERFALPAGTLLLLIVDQFEEAFTLAADTALSFQQALARLADVPGCYVVLTVRADFYADLMTSPLWPSIQAHRVEVTPLSEDGLRRAIVNPAEHAGVAIDAALIERLLADAAGEPGVLPFIQETLVLLWERLDRRFLPLRAYEALVLTRGAYGAGDGGRTGIQVAIARRADATLASLSAEQQAIARRMFLRLIQFGEGRADTRRQQPIGALRSADDAQELFDPTLRCLTDSRLLTLSGAEGGVKKVDIAHEALIRGWPTLQGWLSARRDVELSRRRLEEKAAEWIRLGSSAGGLLDEIELAEAERWLASPDATDLGYDQSLPALTAASRAALDAAAQERESARQRELDAAHALAEAAAEQARSEALAAQRLRRRAWLLAGVGGLALALAVTGFYLFYVAATARNAAQSLALSSESSGLLQSNAETGLALALAAVDKQRTPLSEKSVRSALLATHTWHALIGHQDAVRAIAWSPDGTHLASASKDGTVGIWDVQTRAALTFLSGHTGQVLWVGWSPDGMHVASAGADGNICVWDVSKLNAIGPCTRLAGHTSNVYSVDWSPDSRMLASASKDGTMRIWDVAAAKTLRTLNADAEGVNDAAWSPDGMRLAYAAEGGVARICSVADLLARSDALAEVVCPITLAGHTDAVLSLAWSPDGRRLATSSQDDSIRVWSAAGGSSLDTLVGHRLFVYSVAWSPDGRRLVSSSFDTTIGIWDVATGERTEMLTGHTDWVGDARWSPDGRTLASASFDKSIRLWDVGLNSSVLMFADHTDDARDIAWSPDGRMLASGGYDGLVLARDLAAPEHVQVIAKGDNPVQDIAWSSDSSRLAFISAPEDAAQSMIGIWDMRERRLVRVNVPGAYQFSWKADGREIAVISQKGALQFCDGFTLQCMSAITMTTHNTYSVAWSPDGRTLAFGTDDGSVLIWDIGAARVTATFKEHAGIVWAVAWSPDGSMLASASQDGTARVWDARRGTAASLAVITDHEQAVNDVAWSPDGQTLATTSDDATVRLWSLGRRQSTAILTGPAKGLWKVSWSPDGQRIAASVVDGTSWVFYTRFDDILAFAQQHSPRQMTTEELERYLSVH